MNEELERKALLLIAQCGKRIGLIATELSGSPVSYDALKPLFRDSHLLNYLYDNLQDVGQHRDFFFEQTVNDACAEYGIK